MSATEFDKIRESLDKDHRDILDRFLRRHCEECEKEIRNSIEHDKRHVALVSLVAYAFSESGPLRHSGYHFVATEPLFEFRAHEGGALFDLVLFKERTKSAILVTAKSSIEEPQRDVLDPIREGIRIATDRRKDLEEEVGGEIKELEFVVCASPIDIEEIENKLRPDEPICLWSADIQHSTLQIHFPDNISDGVGIVDRVRRRQINQDTDLRDKLSLKIRSSGQVGYRMLVSSHICRILARTVVGLHQKYLAGTSHQERVFMRNEVKALLQDELPGLPASEIEKKCSEIIKTGSLIKIFESEENLLTRADSFKLKLGGRSARSIESMIETLYARHLCQEKSPMEALREYKSYVRKNVGSLDYIFDSILSKDNDIRI